MSNPFLFDDEVETGAQDTAPNPFLFGDGGGEAETEAEPENPFLAATEEEDLGNPFALADEPTNQPQTTANTDKLADTHAVDKAMSFFGTTITEDDDTADVAQPAITTTAPPPRPTPPNSNQELISSVVDQLDQTSSHLLDCIPKTRTPSPVSMRDLHTPSPTPESANLLMTDALSSDNPFANVEEDDEPIFPVSEL